MSKIKQAIPEDYDALDDEPVVIGKFNQNSVALERLIHNWVNHTIDNENIIIKGRRLDGTVGRTISNAAVRDLAGKIEGYCWEKANRKRKAKQETE